MQHRASSQQAGSSGICLLTWEPAAAIERQRLARGKTQRFRQAAKRQADAGLALHPPWLLLPHRTS